MRAESPSQIQPIGRRERRKLEVHMRIIDVSLELLDARGVEATTVHEICERADIAQKTFFNHFPSKRHLFREVAQTSLSRLLRQIEDARKQPLSTSGRIQFFFESIATHAEEAGPMHRELLTELVHVAHESETGQAQTRQLHDAFESLIRDGLDAGDVSTMQDPETLTELLMGSFYALTFNWAHLDGYPVRTRAMALAGLLAESIKKEN